MTGRWVCAACGSPWAPGAPCCPQCRSTKHTEETEDGMPKIARDGHVSYEADATSPAVLEEKLEVAQEQIAELEATRAVPVVVPAEASPAAPPAPRPRMPPRRAAPPAAADG